LLGMSHPAYSERKKRGSIPYEKIIEICREKGISADYIFSGHAEVFNGSVMQENDLSGINEDDMIIVPYFKDIKTAAGFGCINDDSSYDDMSYIVLPRSGYPELALSSSHLHAITVHGDSMEGNIMDGAIILIDLGDKGAESGKIYVVNVDGEIYVKRLFTDPTSKDTILLRSDNIYYPQFTVNRNNLDVIGRVVFVYNRAKLV
ncbi:LexA family transcriptional regulator, partial [Sulfuricurvum sp.]|uniref:LexA family transcriptional regulator n=1 Tax=Sulfuricurvum sp. TaxID=2025608 RepID=UPI002D6B6F15